jgi:CheY-like chemotaxis protein
VRILLIERNEDNRTVYRTILEHFIKDVELVERRPAEIEAAEDVMQIVKAEYDCIILPLTLPGYNSLRIAEFVHHFGHRTCLFLLSQTDADPAALQVVFDAVLSPPVEPRRIVATVTQCVGSTARWSTMTMSSGRRSPGSFQRPPASGRGPTPIAVRPRTDMAGRPRWMTMECGVASASVRQRFPNR